MFLIFILQQLYSVTEGVSEEKSLSAVNGRRIGQSDSFAPEVLAWCFRVRYLKSQVRVGLPGTRFPPNVQLNSSHGKPHSAPWVFTLNFFQAKHVGIKPAGLLLPTDGNADQNVIEPPDADLLFPLSLPGRRPLFGKQPP